MEKLLSDEDVFLVVACSSFGEAGMKRLVARDSEAQKRENPL
jgi:hypothetical protein